MVNNNNNLLGKKLKELRRAHSYTQDYLAEVLGVVRQTYSNYEIGKRTPDFEALYKIAGLYNISIDDLMHLSIDLDKNIYYDAPQTTKSALEINDYITYYNTSENRKNTSTSVILRKNYYTTSQN